MDKFLEKFPSTANILSKARSELATLGDISTIKQSKDLKQINYNDENQPRKDV